jgi:hypothetical protein
MYYQKQVLNFSNKMKSTLKLAFPFRLNYLHLVQVLYSYILLNYRSGVVRRVACFMHSQNISYID